MAKNIIIFGAGASAPFGAPTMATFLDVAQTLVAPGSGDKSAKSFENVFKAISSLQVVHSKAEFDLVNLESVFTAFELAKTLQRFPDRTPDAIDSLIDDLKRVIIVTLERCLRFPVHEGIVHAHHPLEQFFSKITRSPSNDAPSVAVLTFNYDVAVDMALMHSGIGVDYAIAKEPRAHGHIPLLKLHGSLNWGIETESGRIVPWFMREYFTHFRVQPFSEIKDAQIPIGSHIHRYAEFSQDHKQVADVPVIVPPSWNKADSHRSISSVWSRAANELAEADSIFVIGYSLPSTDAFFRQLYALGSVGPVLLKRFWVFNPDETREVVFRDLLGPGARSRFVFHKMKLEEALALIAQTVRK